MRFFPGFLAAIFFALCAHAAPSTLIVPAADGAYPLAAEVGWRFEQRAAIPTRIQRTNTRDALRAFCEGRNKWVLVARPMLRDELDACTAGRVRFVEIPFALDAVIMVTTRATEFKSDMTRDKLVRLWRQTAGAPRERWSQIDPVWPNTLVTLAAPPKGSSVLDYLERNGIGEPLRSDYQVFADLDQIPMYVAYKRNWMGFVEYSYFRENRNKLYGFPFSNQPGVKAVPPTPAAIVAGEYPALIKPLLMYVEIDALADVTVEKFAATLLELAADLHNDERRTDVHYLPLPETAYPAARERLRTRTLGSRFNGEFVQGARLLELLNKR